MSPGLRVFTTRLLVGVSLATVTVGCYTLKPVHTSSPLLGSEIALDLNDAGRAAMGGAMGPEIAQVEGRLVQNDSSGYVLAVSAVRLLRGGEQVWTGERVTFKSDFVSAVSERKLSRGRTALFTAAGAGAIALIVTRAIIGSGSVDPDKMPGDTLLSIRIPWP